MDETYNSPKRLLSETVIDRINGSCDYLFKTQVPQQIFQVIQHQLKSIKEEDLEFFCSVCTKHHQPFTKCYFLRSISLVLIHQQPYCPFHETCIGIPKNRILNHFAQNHFISLFKKDWILTTIFCCCYLFPTNQALLDCLASYLILGKECPEFFPKEEYILIKSRFNGLLGMVFVDSHNFKDEIEILKNYKPKYNPMEEILGRVNFWDSTPFLNENFDTIKFNINDIEIISKCAKQIVTRELDILKSQPKHIDLNEPYSSYRLIDVEWIRNIYTLQTFDTFRYQKKADIEHILSNGFTLRSWNTSENENGKFLKRTNYQEDGKVTYDNKRKKTKNNNINNNSDTEILGNSSISSDDLAVLGETKSPDPVSDIQGMIKLRDFLAKKFIISRDGLNLDLRNTMCLFDKGLDMPFQLLEVLIKSKLNLDNLNNFQIIKDFKSVIKENCIFIRLTNLNDLGSLMFMGFNKNNIVTTVFIGSCNQESAQKMFREVIPKQATFKEVRFGAYSKSVRRVSNFELFTILDEISIISKYFEINHENFCSCFGRIKKYIKNIDTRDSARRTLGKLLPRRTKDEVKYAYQLKALLETMFSNNI